MNMTKVIATMTSDCVAPQKIKWDPTACTIVRSDARCLIVRVALPTICFCLVSAHAPHSHCEESVIDAFWTSLWKSIQPHTDAQLLIGIDANGRVGTIPTLGIGTFQAEVENYNGAHLRRFLDAAELFAPSTFDRTPWESPPLPGTWRSRAGWHRLDYLLIPRGWAHSHIVMATDQLGFDVTSEDHISLSMCLHAQFTIRGTCPFKVLRKPFHREAMLTPDGKQMCGDLMRAFTHTNMRMLWATPVDRQHALFEEWFAKCLPQCFPLPKASKRAARLSEATRSALIQSRHARKSIRETQRFIQRASLRAIFHEWAFQAETLRVSQIGPPPSTAWLKECHLSIAHRTREVQTLRSSLENMLKQDEAAHMQELADRY